MSSITNPNPNPNPNPPPKKKRNLPGTPAPDAQVIALSPKSLMATNSCKFICEICNKGFRRNQNLQLHRRGHNLPWKLRQRAPGAEIRKRVYICPEPGCVHHEPGRALGDLTGIKKHFSRKHGEKKWKCERCAKKYAVRSDWKAHVKTCGTREYKCDCGVIFSRKDSFITHRAFCDALTQETATLSLQTTTNLSITLPTVDVALSETSEACNVLFSSNNAASNNIINQTNISTAPPPTTMSSSITAHLSATALLQKAAQMGASMSSASSSLFGGLFAEQNQGSTRDFLGVGRSGGGGSLQELAKFGYLGS